MTAIAHQLVSKSDVSQRLGVSERTLEKLVRARKFPPPLRLGKQVRWAETAVNTWLAQQLESQLSWTPTQRRSRRAD